MDFIYKRSCSEKKDCCIESFKHLHNLVAHTTPLCTNERPVSRSRDHSRPIRTEYDECGSLARIVPIPPVISEHRTSTSAGQQQQPGTLDNNNRSRALEILLLSICSDVHKSVFQSFPISKLEDHRTSAGH